MTRQPTARWPSLFGLTAFAWGGEKLDVFQLDVPEAYLGMDLTW